ncbi:MAG: D-alanine--D-alanine ligase, partial [Calditrichae bacterium]|nr:D-alanine--D-alanine ligase [Calditrichia bacterium]
HSGLQNIDLVFPALHGTFGEDGTVQGFLEILGKPYLGAGVLASALAMDKISAKRAFAGAGIPITPDIIVDEENTSAEISERIQSGFGFPIFVKPNLSGSSVGVYKVKRPEDLNPIIAEARKYSQRVIIEPDIGGIELECSVLVTKETVIVSEIGEVKAPHRPFYDFQAKFQLGQSEIHIPAKIPEEVRRRAMNFAKTAVVEVLKAAGLSRVDLRYNPETDKLYLIEVNTIPGMASQSTAIKLLEASGITYRETLERLIEDGLNRGQRRKQLQNTISTEMNKAEFIQFALAGSRVLSLPWWLGQAARLVAWLMRFRVGLSNSE